MINRAGNTLTGILQWLDGRKGFAILIGVAALIALPTLLTGFFLDDYAHLMALDGRNPVAGPWNIYRFAPGDPEKMMEVINPGPFPWFTDPTLKVEFFRPLASLTMMLDRRLFGNAAWAYHLHSVFWYLALLLVAAGILRRSLPGSLGLLAFALFAVDETHWFPVMWWSHRNTFVASTFGFAGLLAHLRWREDGWKPGLPLSLLGLGLGLLGGETALCILGFFCAYELGAGAGTRTRRAAALTPALVLGVAYLAFYSLAGYTVRGTDCYISPLADPLSFLSKAPERALILIANQFFTWPAEIAAFLPLAVWPSAAIGAMAVIVVGLALRQLWPRLQPMERTGVAWLGIGSLLALPPFLAPFSSGRLLLVCSLGSAAVIAVIIREGWPLRPHPVFGLARVFVVLHLIIAPLVWLVLSPGYAFANAKIVQAVADIELDDARVAQQQVMLINPSDPVLGIYASAMRQVWGQPMAAAWRPLSFAPFDHEFTRTGPNAFELNIVNGEMLTTIPECIARSASNPFHAGDVRRFSEFDVTILEVGEYGPKRMAFQFREPLEDPRYVWLAEDGGRMRVFTLPEIGETALLKWSTLFMPGGKSAD